MQSYYPENGLHMLDLMPLYKSLIVILFKGNDDSFNLLLILLESQITCNKSSFDRDLASSLLMVKLSKINANKSININITKITREIINKLLKIEGLFFIINNIGIIIIGVINIPIFSRIEKNTNLVKDLELLDLILKNTTDSSANTSEVSSKEYINGEKQNLIVKLFNNKAADKSVNAILIIIIMINIIG